MMSESDRKKVVVAFASDDRYCPYLSVAILSLIRCSVDERNYLLLILSDGISENNQRILGSMVDGRANFSLEFVDVSKYLEEFSFEFTNKSLSRSAFGRMLLPEILPDCSKVLYLDCDILVKRDVSDLFDRDLGSCYAGAIEDNFVRLLRQIDSFVRDHCQKIVQDGAYFNSGVMLLNLEQIRARYSGRDLLSISASRKWVWEDQDVLNIVFAGNVQWLEPGWNVIYAPYPEAQPQMEEDKAYCKAARSPWIVHFAGGGIPTKKDGHPWTTDFWMLARSVPYYEELLLCFLRRHWQKNLKEHTKETDKASPLEFVEENGVVVRRLDLKWYRLKCCKYAVLRKISAKLEKQDYYDRKWRLLRRLNEAVMKENLQK